MACGIRGRRLPDPVARRKPPNQDHKVDLVDLVDLAVEEEDGPPADQCFF